MPLHPNRAEGLEAPLQEGLGSEIPCSLVPEPEFEPGLQFLGGVSDRGERGGSSNTVTHPSAFLPGLHLGRAGGGQGPGHLAGVEEKG